jgi:aspartate-semialdehyde dehydrogenase
MAVVAVVHPTSLLARELRERLESRPDLCTELRLLSDDEEEIGALTESAGGAAFVGRLNADSFDGVDLAFVCGGPSDGSPALRLLPVDLPAVLLGPDTGESDVRPAVAGVAPAAWAGLDRLASPHPAAVALALLVDALAPLEPKRAAATIVLPVSELGEAGIDELFGQTRAILAFDGKASRPKRYAAQIAFNLLPAAADADAVERAARAALARDLDLGVQLVQGGIFHGVAVSLRVELGAEADVQAVRRQLGHGAGVALARDPAKVGPVAVAGDEQVLVGAVRADGAAGAFWIWAVMDNLVRGGALNALELGAALLGRARPS